MTWKKVFEDGELDYVHKMEVEGGYLYRDILLAGVLYHVNLVFVPTPDKCPYHDRHRMYECYEPMADDKVSNDS